MSWLRSLSKSKSKLKRYSTPAPINYLEVGSNAWTLSSKKDSKENKEKKKSTSELFFRSAMKASNNNGKT
eukprot:CAMPEP_0170960662 /NCGR_PEP_ID=MMETSP0735-20130129/37399_1 /TAXON_ID=186038 /ORGANISM="Fragilariopsis kerguelensis, Strain L26-C5" /LENGTH=69 /DNA_ID=CAMNT_0011375749 /DNA_START=20 /DNA_END=226 /DNA_ORIENTATION=-